MERGLHRSAVQWRQAYQAGGRRARGAGRCHVRAEFQLRDCSAVVGCNDALAAAPRAQRLGSPQIHRACDWAAEQAQPHCKSCTMSAETTASCLSQQRRTWQLRTMLRNGSLTRPSPGGGAHGSIQLARPQSEQEQCHNQTCWCMFRRCTLPNIYTLTRAM